MVWEALKKNLKNNYKQRLQFVLFFLVLLTLFYIFSFMVKGGRLARFDFDMTVRVQDKIVTRWDPLLSIFSLIGSFEATVAILIFVVILTRKLRAFIPLFFFGLMHVVEIVGKAFLDHPGTPFMFHRYSLDLIFPSSYVQPGGSYPSGHAMRSAFLATIIIFLIVKSKRFSQITKRVLIGLLFLFLIIMMVSRISLGEHWTSDVIGGTLLGTAFSLLSLAVF